MAPSLKSYEECLIYCRQQGMRLSNQRQLVLKLLWDTDEHLPASEIYDRLRQRGEAIGHTSVYQNLDALAKAGVIERVERAEGCLYSHHTSSHSHVRCLDDNRLLDVDVKLPPELVKAVEQQIGLKVIDYHIEFLACKPSENADVVDQDVI
ncbi:transcriptional repressor [Leptolyngbya sp. NK1-12]|uniref:Transcriptional repressor n=1 Tax=Leptolyngbya sp. NK1-12 TaxID=2547451 RepID=A0AA96WBC6_9CYAN|nr:Fur family transcriptional regulator [Leptolyngbya sp. NK1-12]WNZ21919.1 transcriptional repressor [Leptolyngbya sp. NK1-12]